MNYLKGQKLFFINHTENLLFIYSHILTWQKIIGNISILDKTIIQQRYSFAPLAPNSNFSPEKLNKFFTLITMFFKRGRRVVIIVFQMGCPHTSPATGRKLFPSASPGLSIHLERYPFPLAASEVFSSCFFGIIICIRFLFIALMHQPGPQYNVE